MKRTYKFQLIATVTALALLFSSLVNGVTHDSATSAEAATLDLQPTKIQAKTAKLIIRQLDNHYARQPFNNQLSSRLLDRYLKDLDSSRSHFTQTDIDEFEQYRFKLDDQLIKGDTKPGFLIYSRYQLHLSERLGKYQKWLEDPVSNFNFEEDESLVIDRSDKEWPANQNELELIWHKQLKNQILTMSLNGKEVGEIQETLQKRYANQIRRLTQTTSEDIYQAYLNSLTQLYDPHTQYFSPRKSENFNINMSLSLQGIGAVLRSEDGITKVERLVPGGPAQKAGELKAADHIVGIQEGDHGEMVDVIGWRLDEVVGLIRGPKGTLIKLSVISSTSIKGSPPKTLSIIRDDVKLEEQAAKSEIIEIPSADGTIKIGVIDLPAFYVDFDAKRRGDKNYRSATRDIKKLLAELNEESVDGIIIDLRDNGGGSLEEANSVVGLFIRTGPTVQIRTATGKVELMGDTDPSISYGGPLAVLVNRLSASASEIFAGAIQDYQRGIIIGDRTFGKGTVQTLRGLPHGQLKLTQAKFYRISGESNQHRGIVPDITLPSLINKEEIGESALDNALPWDSIRRAPYYPYSELSGMLGTLQAEHSQRVTQNPDFVYINNQLAILNEVRNQKEVSLKRTNRESKRTKIETQQLAIENQRRIAKGLSKYASYEELEKNNSEQENPDTLSSIDTEDPMLQETGQILGDYIELDARMQSDETNNTASVDKQQLEIE